MSAIQATIIALLGALTIAAAQSAPSSDLVATILKNMASHEARYVAELQEFVAIPSVSAVPDHQPDILRAADWVSRRLSAAGFDAVRLLPNPAGPRPAVFGERIVSRTLPTALLYGHYDVQPADPLDAWTTPPFDPVVRDGALFGRGASDDKGCLLGPLQALEAWMNATNGALPVNFKIIIEGEEEIGSPYLEPFLDKYKDVLAADFVLSADGSQISETQPSIALGLRGAAAVEVRVTALARDVHSGTQYV
jgi:acetylornithine deacetylase/succinyl-diaminopimelate desuccinylase-like protein